MGCDCTHLSVTADGNADRTRVFALLRPCFTGCLTSASEHGNVYAAQLLHSIHANRNWSAAMGAIRLLHHISRIIQNRLEDERRGKGATIDRKLRRKIDEKKQAHGLKQG